MVVGINYEGFQVFLLYIRSFEDSKTILHDVCLTFFVGLGQYLILYLLLCVSAMTPYRRFLTALASAVPTNMNALDFHSGTSSSWCGMGIISLSSIMLNVRIVSP